MSTAGNFGFRLRALCTEKRISFKELASILNISYSSLCQYSGGTRSPSGKTQEKLANYFGVDVDYLMGRSETRNASNLVNLIKWELNEDEVALVTSFRKSKPNVKEAILVLLKVHQY